ncbi:het domain containing protein [Sporothrix brasiliensis 5110]|uniref:Het domain containing protein n=1 Tax=Sporothrix brasiliensis 5110 TaxID=1398154 RepID=A0A0C2IZ10_9PEZI|nr:het domain containing protein [Sporothrix brasiliensis 5110]KIH91965.1 het domain containing protein [Sporothrix brasiliensis 5110]
MRLINTKTLELEEHFNNIPPYAILSHTWGVGEVTFSDWREGLETARKKEGFRKIELACQQAACDGYDHAWVDTNCIDKTSSSELSEAINSMFAWYRDAEVCYVFMKDVVVPGEDGNPMPLVTPGETPPPPPGGLKKYLADPTVRRAFKSSAWFTRGWTLQELLAPAKVLFFSYEWLPLATKETEGSLISDITDIDRTYIKRPDYVSTASVARRMSWMAKRRTTRIEDTAYCLLGLFGIHMALLYGEGHRAFLRLQEEIIRVSDDQTIFCWQATKMGLLPPPSLSNTEDMVPAPAGTGNATSTSSIQQDTHRQAELEQWTSILAPHPKVFRDSALYFAEFGNAGGGGGTMGGWNSGGSMSGSVGSLGTSSGANASSHASEIGPYSITNFGLSISLPLLYTAKGACAVLDVGYRRTSSDRASRVVIPLHRVRNGHYIRLSTQLLIMQIPAALTATRTQIFVDCRNAQSRGISLLLGQRITARSINMVGGAGSKHQPQPVLFLTFNRPVDLDRTPLAASDMDFVPFHSAIEVSTHRPGTQSAVILSGKATAAGGNNGYGNGKAGSAMTESFHLLVGARANHASFRGTAGPLVDFPGSGRSGGSAATKKQRGILPHSSSSSTSMSSSTPGTPTSASTATPGLGISDDQISMDWHADIWARPPPTLSISTRASGESAALQPLISRLSADYFGSWCTSPALCNVLSWRYSANGALVVYFELGELYSSGSSDEPERSDGSERSGTPKMQNGDDDERLRFSHLRRSPTSTSSMQQLFDMMTPPLASTPPKMTVAARDAPVSIMWNR